MRKISKVLLAAAAVSFCVLTPVSALAAAPTQGQATNVVSYAPAADHNGPYYENGQWTMYNNGTQIKNQAYEYQGNTYYYNEAGYLQFGFVTYQTGGVYNTYYQNPDNGIRMYGAQKIGSYFYFFRENGTMVTSATQQIGNDLYYYNAQGHMEFGKTEHRNSANIMQTFYYNTNDGKRNTGIMKLGNQFYYFNPSRDGEMAVGVTNINSYLYYYNDNGQLQFGIQQHDDSNGNPGRFFYDENDGTRQYGNIKVNNAFYYFKPSAEGMAATDVQIINGQSYYYAANGQLQFGWQVHNDANSNPGRFFYNRNDGTRTYGTADIDNAFYNLGTDGVRKTGHQTINGNQYYYSEGTVTDTDAGQLQFGIFEDAAGHIFYANEDSGIKQVGTMQVNGAFYYFQQANSTTSYGQAAVGMTEIGSGNWYYYDLLTAKMQFGVVDSQNTTAGPNYGDPTGNLYFFAEDSGIRQYGAITYRSAEYYADAKDGTNPGLLLTADWRTGGTVANPVYYYYKADGRMAKAETVNGLTDYPDGTSGNPAKNFIFDENGVCTNPS